MGFWPWGLLFPRDIPSLVQSRVLSASWDSGVLTISSTQRSNMFR